MLRRQYHASPNISDRNGNTPVHLLVKGRPTNLIEKLDLLTKDGEYNPLLKNEMGLTGKTYPTRIKYSQTLISAAPEKT